MTHEAITYDDANNDGNDCTIMVDDFISTRWNLSII